MGAQESSFVRAASAPVVSLTRAREKNDLADPQWKWQCLGSNSGEHEEIRIHGGSLFGGLGEVAVASSLDQDEISTQGQSLSRTVSSTTWSDMCGSMSKAPATSSNEDLDSLRQRVEKQWRESEHQKLAFLKEVQANPRPDSQRSETGSVGSHQSIRSEPALHALARRRHLPRRSPSDPPSSSGSSKSAWSATSAPAISQRRRRLHNEACSIEELEADLVVAQRRLDTLVERQHQEEEHMHLAELELSKVARGSNLESESLRNILAFQDKLAVTKDARLDAENRVDTILAQLRRATVGPALVPTEDLRRRQLHRKIDELMAKTYRVDDRYSSGTDVELANVNRTSGLTPQVCHDAPRQKRSQENASRGEDVARLLGKVDSLIENLQSANSKSTVEHIRELGTLRDVMRRHHEFEDARSLAADSSTAVAVRQPSSGYGTQSSRALQPSSRGRSTGLKPAGDTASPSRLRVPSSRRARQRSLDRIRE